MVYWFWSYRSWVIKGGNIKKLLSQLKNNIYIYIFKGLYLANGSSECTNSLHFLKELNKVFQMFVNIFSKLPLIFCWHHQKIQKMSHFWHFNDHNSGSNLLFEFNPFLYFYFFFFVPSKLSSLGVHPMYYFLVCKMHIDMPKMPFSRLT